MELRAPGKLKERVHVLSLTRRSPSVPRHTPVRVVFVVASILVALLPLTSCLKAEMGTGDVEPTELSSSTATPLAVAVTSSVAYPTSSPDPIATRTPTPRPGRTITATPLPVPTWTDVPSPTAAPSPKATQCAARTGRVRQTPRILSFSAQPVEGMTGVGVRLTWEAVGERATLCPLLSEEVVGCRCLFDVPLAGSHVILPSQIIGSYSGFRLTVESRGIRTLRYAPLTVPCPEAHPDWFFENPPGICPKDAPLLSYAAAQRFEHGTMIWIEALDAYYVLLDHHLQATALPKGSSSLTSLRVIRGPLDLKPGADPDNRVEGPPPPGLFEPVSGFGLVWRGEVRGAEDVRGALGWAMGPEYGFDTVYQCEMSCGSHWNCYLQGPEGEILHLTWLLHVGRFWEVVGPGG